MERLHVWLGDGQRRSGGGASFWQLGQRGEVRQVILVLSSSSDGPRARHGVLELVAAVLSSGCFDNPQVARVRERAKAPHFGGGGAYGCRFTS
jgi:hypothetical protein